MFTLISAYDGNRQALGKRRGSSFTTKVEAIRDKCRTEQASLLHLFWSCTKLTSLQAQKQLFAFSQKYFRHQLSPLLLQLYLEVPEYGTSLNPQC